MTHGNKQSEKCGEAAVVAVLAMVSVVSLMLASPDSYLHDLFNRVDSAWFYLCGKAWASGMTPYVDFTDSKGPLLWLFYAMAYLISPRDYTGVYWLTCVDFTLTLWLFYRSARLLLPGRRWALMASLLMPLAFFYPHVHEEVKTELLSQPLVALCLYGTLLLQRGRWLPLRTPRRVCLATGAAMGCALMIKYSFVPMLAIFALYDLGAARRHGQGVWRSLLWLAAGALVAVLPWVAWMLAVGNMGAFVEQYFMATMGTLGGLSDMYGGPVDLLRKFLLFPAVAALPLLCFGGALLTAWHERGGERASRTWRMSLPVMATGWFFALTFVNAWWIYYYEMCVWTLFFGITALLAAVAGRRACPVALLAVVALAAPLAAGAWTVLITPANFFAAKHPARDTYWRYAALMSQVQRPTVIYWDIYACGFETPAGGLPGTLYWAGQNGATPAMREAQEQAVRAGVADFVFVADTLHDRQLQQWGYHKCDYSRRDSIEGCDDLLYTLYTRHTLKPLPQDFGPPSPTEIVGKQNVAQRYSN